MPAKKNATKRRSEAIVEDDKGPKKVKGKLVYNIYEDVFIWIKCPNHLLDK